MHAKRTHTLRLIHNLPLKLLHSVDNGSFITHFERADDHVAYVMNLN